LFEETINQTNYPNILVQFIAVLKDNKWNCLINLCFYYTKFTKCKLYPSNFHCFRYL